MENKKRILIVDDKAVNRDILIELLGADYIFLEAEEGGKAVELLKEHKTAIDMVILDLIMPGKDGFSVLEWLLQQKWRELVPVMVVSADERAFTIDKVYADINERVACKESFFHLFVDTFFDSRYISLADSSTFDKIFEGVILSSFDWEDFDDDSTELTMTTRLLLV